MKKLLTILSIASLTTLLHAQGLVYMYGQVHAGTNTSVSSYSGGTESGGVGGLTAGYSSGQIYYFALLYSTASTTPSLTASSLNSSAWTFSGVTATNYTAAGSIFGTGGAGGAAVTGLAAGSSASVDVVGWSASLGSSWATVASELSSGNWVNSGYFGVSSVGTIIAGGGNSPATAVFGGNGVSTSGFSLYAVSSVPEPTTVALIGLGGLGLAMIRRRK